MNQIIAFDKDGTIDVDPDFWVEFMETLRSGGWYVIVLSGFEGDVVDENSVAMLQKQLTAMGFEDAYDEAISVANPHDVNKAAIVENRGISCLIDNNKDNVKALPGSCIGLVPWATRE